MTLLAISPRLLYVIVSKEIADKPFLLDRKQLVQNYRKNALQKAQRSVMFTDPRQLLGAYEWFWPQDIYLKDYGPGTPMEHDEYPFGEKYALMAAG